MTYRELDRLLGALDDAATTRFIEGIGRGDAPPRVIADLVTYGFLVGLIVGGQLGRQPGPKPVASV